MASSWMRRFAPLTAALLATALSGSAAAQAVEADTHWEDETAPSEARPADEPAEPDIPLVDQDGNVRIVLRTIAGSPGALLIYDADYRLLASIPRASPRKLPRRVARTSRQTTSEIADLVLRIEDLERRIKALGPGSRR